jgi:hypothetical protein
VKPGGPEVSLQHWPAGQSESQTQRSRHAPATHVDFAGQLSVKTVAVHAADPSLALLKRHRPVGVVICEVSTSHCWKGLQPVSCTGSQTATVRVHPAAESSPVLTLPSSPVLPAPLPSSPDIAASVVGWTLASSLPPPPLEELASTSLASSGNET